MAGVVAAGAADDELGYPVYIGPFGVPSVSKFYDKKTAYPGTNFFFFLLLVIQQMVEQ
jgi:hypothetical protein